jgi:steroid delta-isomerase-like uncharacterized protein
MDRVADRWRTVGENLRCASAQDIEGVLRTFGNDARLEDEASGERLIGRDGVRDYYERLIGGLPDLAIDVRAQHATDDALIVESWLSGTHAGMFQGMPGTERHVLCPLCVLFTFDDDDKLALTRLYYDRATLMRQIGLLHP